VDTHGGEKGSGKTKGAQDGNGEWNATQPGNAKVKAIKEGMGMVEGDQEREKSRFCKSIPRRVKLAEQWKGYREQGECDKEG
jgi:hypothetical protein